ncbi:hypothetical protein [Microcystis aeruginosa]|uniref:Uncharacterized protein n=1 Tax=Microcystis aeruginosa NIES-3807 TaxID=2517785 RepID=A0AAD3B2A9_MICAE|nr:hypothetical protein [Microcystis aeruginosa]GCL59836.1 hypothetical protein NIES3807_30130 [Microcystis aeruginosa NIES-3807]
MTQAKERLLTDTQSANNSIVLDLEEFDLSDLDSLKDTALGNILKRNVSSSPSAHTSHSSHSSHEVHSQSMW